MAHTAELASPKSQKRIDNANPALMPHPSRAERLAMGKALRGQVSARCARRMEGAAQPA